MPFIRVLPATNTLAIIKPDAVERGIVGEILTRIERVGFRIEAMRGDVMDVVEAEKLYAVHKQREGFHDLIRFTCSGPSIKIILSHNENAVARLRRLAGAVQHDGTPVFGAPIPGSIRGDFATGLRHNVIHASDSIAMAQYEIDIFFPDYFGKQAQEEPADSCKA